MPSWRSTDDGANSNVNAMLLRLYRAGLTDVTYGDCDAAETKIAKIVSVMTVPLVQGTLKYAYSSGDGKSVGTDGKAFAEMNAFGSSLIARVHACNAEAAAVLDRNMAIPKTWTDETAAAVVPDGWAAVKTAIESVSYTHLTLPTKRIV